MAGINSLYEIYKQKGDEFIKNVLGGFMIITEQVGGSYFAAKYNASENKFDYYKKNARISYIDRILTKFFEKPISHFEAVPAEIKSTIPDGYTFGMQFISKDEERPTLYLTHIQTSDSNVKIHEQEVLTEWASKLDLTDTTILFTGHLQTEDQEKVLDFIYTPYRELLKKFKTQSFTEYIMDILHISKSDYRNINSIVFRFYDENRKESAILAKLVDPVIQEMSKANDPQEKESPHDYLYLIVIDLMNFIESLNNKELQSIIKKELEFDANYINLMNEIFLRFMDKYQYKYLDIKLELPEFLSKPEFALNLELIDNEKVKTILGIHPTFTEIYKILLNFFRRQRKNAVGIFTPNMLLHFNSIVKKINNIVTIHRLYEGELPSFSEYTGNILEVFNPIPGDNIKDQYRSYKQLQKVNIIVDAFQPITLDHIQAAALMKSKNKYPTVFLVVHDNLKTDRHPFKYVTIKKMIDLARSEYNDLIVDFKFIFNANIENIVNALYPYYQPMLLGTTKSMMYDYILQLDYAKKKSIKYNLHPDFKVTEIQVQNSVNALEYIRNNDYKSFRDVMPQSLHSDFINYQYELKSD